MQSIINNPDKGGNLCTQFTSTTQARNAIYNNVSRELSPLEQQQQKIAGVFEYTVAGIAQAIENTNSGWKVDEAFKEGDQIKPVTVLPAITTETVENDVEVWDPNIDVTQAVIDTVSAQLSHDVKIVTTDSTGVTWIVLNQQVRGTDDIINTVCVLYRIPPASNTPVPSTGLVLNHSISPLSIADSSIGYKIQGLCLQLFSPALTPTMVEIWGSLENVNLENQATTYFIWTVKYEDSTLTTRSVTSLANTIGQPIKANSVVFSPRTATDTFLIHYVRADNNKGYFCIFDGGWTHVLFDFPVNALVRDVDGYVYVSYQFDATWLSRLIRGRFVSGSFEYREFFATTGTTYFMCLAPDQQYLFLGDGTSSQIVCHVFQTQVLTTLYRTPIIDAINAPSAWAAGVDYLFLSVNITQDSSVILAINYKTGAISSYGQYLSSQAQSMCYFNKLYIGGTSSNGKVYYTTIDCLKSSNTSFEVEADTPLYSFCNLKHNNGSSLQVSCQRNYNAMELFNNDRSFYYKNDVGLAFFTANRTPSTTEIAANQVSANLCSMYSVFARGGTLNYEVMSGLTLGDLIYSVIANRDGNFVGLMLQNSFGVIANIGCGNLIDELQYPAYDTSALAHVLYYSLGFVTLANTTQPSDNSTASMWVAFVAPNYDGFKFYSGRNTDSNLDVVFTTQASSYQYVPTNTLAIDDDNEHNVYVFPLIVGIRGDNPIYYFNNESGLKGGINRKYLVKVNLNAGPTLNRGTILDNGNYLYLGYNWALGWDASNSKNPYNN